MSIKMQSCRIILDKYPGYNHISKLIESIESSLDENPPLVFDLSRALIESVFKSILTDLGVNCDSWGMKELFQNVYQHITILPNRENENRKTLENFSNILQVFNDVIRNISEIRHEEGISSHGKDGSFTPLDVNQAAFIAGATDVVAAFILNTHFNYRTIKETRIITYEDYIDENEIIDSDNPPLYCYDLVFDVSYILYSLDKTAYINVIEEIHSGLYEKDTD